MEIEKQQPTVIVNFKPCDNAIDKLAIVASMAIKAKQRKTMTIRKESRVS